MIDKSILKELKEELEKCTPGEWAWDEPANWIGLSARVFCREPYGVVAQVPVEAWRPKSIGRGNANFIVLAKNHMLSLLNSYEEMEKERDDKSSLLQWILNKVETCCPAICTRPHDWQKDVRGMLQGMMHQLCAEAQANATYARIAREQQQRAESAESSLDQMKQTVRTLADALRHLREHTEMKGNACKFLAVAKADAALSDPIVKQILEEK